MRWATLALLPLLCGCQITYFAKSAKGQLDLWWDAVPVERALSDPSLTPEQHRKIQLAVDAKLFAQEKLGLKPTANYSKFVDLKRPFVTWVVSAAPKWELKSHEWSYPIVGRMPYKGYFNEPDARAEAEVLKTQDLDTYLRGVSAYSTLGWFNDNLLSSMLSASDADLVNTIIHETTHATLYIKNNADFNERIASFIGNFGAELFYFAREGAESATVKSIRDENSDELAFSKFISGELKTLEAWYASKPERVEAARQAQFAQIRERFRAQLLPHLKTPSYGRFAERELNNARLVLYKTYSGDLNDFDVVFAKLGQDPIAFIQLAKKLEGEKDPVARWREFGQMTADQLRALL